MVGVQRPVPAHDDLVLRVLNHPQTGFALVVVVRIKWACLLELCGRQVGYKCDRECEKEG